MLTDHKAIKKFLTYDVTNGNDRTVSSYVLCLQDVRKLTGRDNNGDTIDNYDSARSWVANCGYFILLDHIGKHIDLASQSAICKACSDKPAIQKALMKFGKFDEDSASTIYALRNAVLHDFGLYNINNNNPSLTKNFQLTILAGSLIRGPVGGWNGVMADRNNRNVTTVDLGLFGDAVEGIHNNLLDLNNSNKLKVIVDGNINNCDEFIDAYMYTHKV